MQNGERREEKRREQLILRSIRSAISEFDTEYQETLSELQQLQAKHDSLASELAELRRQEFFWARKAGEEDIPEVQQTAPLPKSETQTERQKRLASVLIQGSHADAAKRVLQEAGHPLTTNQIIRKLFEEGHPLPPDGRARKTSVYSALWRRRQDFLRVDAGVWGLVGRDENAKVPKDRVIVEEVEEDEEGEEE